MDRSPVTAVDAPPHRPHLDVADLRLLERTTTRLAAALTVRDAVDAVLATVREALDASTCGVFLLDDDGTALVPAGGDLAGPRPAGRAPHLPLTASAPSAQAARTRAPVLLRSPGELAARFDDPLNERLVAAGERSWAVLPMLTEAGLIGVLRVGLPREGSLDEVQQLLAATLAGQCACAVERARLFDAARDAARDARRAEQRYRTLAEAGRLDVFTAAPGRGLTSDLPGWRALTGRDGDLLGGGWTADVHPADLPGLLTEAATAVRAGRAATARLRVRTPAGWRWLAVTAQPVPVDPDDPTGPVLEWVGAVEDVDERVRARRRTRALQGLTAALSTATTRAGVVDAALRACLQLPGTTRASLTLLEEERGPRGAVAVHRLRRDGRREHLVRGDRTAAELLRDVEACAAAGGWYVAGTAGAAALPAWTRPVYLEALAEGDAAWAVLPLVTPRRHLGGLVIGSSEDCGTCAACAGGAAVLDDEERCFLLALAGQVAGALDRVELLERERGTARVLQEALKPGPLVRVPWLLAHRSTSTSAGVDVGGDWAELVAVGGDRVAVVLGDVMGRGARAATVMGEVRAQVRALALVDPHPAAVLRGLDACAAATGADDLVTLAYVLLSRDGTALAASAGHPPPLLLAGGTARYLDVPAGPPVGALLDGAGARARDGVLELRLGPGEELVLFSDGLVETRDRPLDEGMAAARQQVAGCGGAPLAELVDDLVRALTSGEPGDDDLTVLAVRRTGAGVL
ncbi:SpoIIE family protein phosphatase [Paenibacillus sp. TRM 82003]|uniref:SpoIIE family protein phosphatase n=1 Tax=Kineococcus sp. TRM81007 TaxID=2925831 RepID=UPI001F58AD23|nr:SpoIIE family protein phosphatase [Kineococcus sp. TRM81007]MCI2236918.1 SpoIIE family protein phosphatase [Kineococcus sp. TRM81007]MCI3921910.1 SpoIIE family protein phosphatase [Paenibacillus sp. TRM 82003]